MILSPDRPIIFYRQKNKMDINYAGGYLPDITIKFILLTLYLFSAFVLWFSYILNILYVLWFVCLKKGILLCPYLLYK